MNIHTNHLKWMLSLLTAMVLFISCNPPILQQQLGDWKQSTPYGGVGRNGAVSFVINGDAFVGLGYNRDNNVYLRDFWHYNATNQSWDTIPPFPGVGRQNAVAFTLNGKGYVGTGLNGSGSVTKELADFYSYDPGAHQWTQVASLPGPARRGATAFAVNNIAYVGTGVNTLASGLQNGLSDFYSYDPTANTWSVIPGYPGPKVFGAFSFVINNQAYMGGGTVITTTIPDNTFWRYDPTNSVWLKLPQLDTITTNVKRFNCASFSQNNLGYVVCGLPNQGTTTFEFNPANNYWTRKTDFEGPSRSDCVGFVVPGLNGGYTCFVGLGSATSTNSADYDFWSFNPEVQKILNN